ncbi:hypothetical protein FQA39_LY04675 [Lamprigera yunnana]|nr:hypothetical protein FQA39_LY04675 [Lamprigera yunnana]
MDPFNLQRQIRNNSDDLVNFCKEMKEWGNEMKTKDAALKRKPDEGAKTTHKVKKETKLVEVEKPKSKVKKRIVSSDYAAWEKFDVEKECTKLDEGTNSDSGDLTDENDEDAQDEAICEKEKGNNFVKNQKWDQAIICYTKAIECYAYDPIFYANRALCYLKLKKFKEAECDCTHSLQLDKTYVKAYQRRAAAREALNQLSEAHSDLLKVFDYEPNNKESKVALGKIEKKIEGINKKPNETASTAQRPISKFTITQQQNQKVKQATPQDKVEISTSPNKSSTYWTSGNEIELVKPINKPPHLRSKQPLRRIVIEDIDIITDNKSENKSKNILIQPWPRPGLDNKTINCDDLKIVERKVNVSNKKSCTSSNYEIHKINTSDFEISIPATSIEFSANWRLLKDNKELKLKYLSQINPNKIPALFKESLDYDIFSEIIQTLAESFVEEKKPVYEYLVKLAEVKRFSMLTMFMNDNDKEAVSKLHMYLQSNSGVSKTKIEDLISKYGS